MKLQGKLALFQLLFLVVRGAAASATARSTRTWQSDSNTLDEAAVSSSDLHGEALIDLSEREAAKRKVLLNRLNKAEALTSVERQALRAQQQVVVALEQEQEVLESKVNALEAAEGAGSSAGFLQQRGTVRSRAGQSRFMRRMAEQSQPQINHVAMEKHETGGQTKALPRESEFVVLLHGVEKDFWERSNEAFYQKMVGIAAYMLQIFIAAMLYMQFCKQSVIPKLPENQVRIDEFQFGLFDGGDIARDCQMCVCALCCPWIRWAESASKDQIQFLTFIPALFITALLSSASTVTFGATVPILLLITVLCRQRIRDAYGLPSGTCGIICGDCLLWICCPCCAIVQEARQVDMVEVPMQEYGIPLSGP